MVSFLLCKLLLQLTAAAVGLRHPLVAAPAVSRCRCCFSSILLQLCWLAAFVGGLVEMAVFSSRVFNVLYLLLGIGKLYFDRSQQEQQAAASSSVLVSSLSRYADACP